MENYPALVPLIILIPAIGAFINIFWGYRLTERAVSIIGTTAAALAFIVALLLFSYLATSGQAAAVVNPPLLDGWIRIPAAGIEIPWQMRVDSLSVTMMLFVTGVGTLIHIYSAGYMHGDPKFYRFFAYLNMFLVFMLVLVTGNNFLMLFVGWEGVGLCSWLLIGFWWEKPKGVGWKNSNAARKAFIVNRIGDFGVLMGIFLTFWTFGTLDFYRPGEIANPNAGHHGEAADHEEATGEHGETLVIGEEGAAGEHGEEVTTDEHGAVVDDGHAEAAVEAEVADEHGTEGAEGDHGEEVIVGGTAGEDHAAADDGHGVADDGHGAPAVVYTDNEHMTYEQLGVFGKALRLMELPENDPARLIHFGPYSADIVAVIGLITFFFLLGATGKSAQIPLFVWLPDAMAGPTPVSALIHAATMVTAGIYLMVRSNVFYAAADLTSFLVTVVGVLTALVAGFIALGQWDIKRVLAYSTVSQLGFMVAAVGIGAYGAAMFHLVTHAFFKALLFLGSGSVIHGVEHGHHELHHGHGHGDHHDPHAAGSKEEAHDTEAHISAAKTDVSGHVHEEEEFDPQDMRNMGGLGQRMPITYITYLIGTLALAGIWPFAGFWSKDEILADSWLAGIVDNNVAGFIALAGLLLAAAFTAFYMWRQVEMVFHGRPRTEAAARAPESHWTMTLPLIVLGVMSVIIGFINLPANAGIPTLGLDGVLGLHNFGTWLEHSVYHLHSADFQPLIAIFALALAIGAILLARSIYGLNRSVTADRRDPLQANPAFGQGWRLANARLYWDETYNRLFERPFNRASTFLADTLDWAFWHDYVHDTVIYKGFNGLARLLSQPVDLGLIDGAVNGLGRLVRWVSGGLRELQTGYVRTYAVTLLFGVILVLVILLWPWIQSTLAAGS